MNGNEKGGENLKKASISNFYGMKSTDLF